MHLGRTEANYDEWLDDQRRRFARAMWNSDRAKPASPIEKP